MTIEEQIELLMHATTCYTIGTCTFEKPQKAKEELIAMVNELRKSRDQNKEWAESMHRQSLWNSPPEGL